MKSKKVGFNIVLLHVGLIWSYPVVVWDLWFMRRDLQIFWVFLEHHYVNLYQRVLVLQWPCVIIFLRVFFLACELRLLMPYFEGLGTWWHSWLRHCATSRKVAGSIPDGVIGIFH